MFERCGLLRFSLKMFVFVVVERNVNCLAAAVADISY
jgi:hypothetical protein